MSFSETIKRNLYLLFNIPYIPQSFLCEMKGPLLLHISDTPQEIYPYLRRIIKIINPQYIVHTGDIVDNIKLQFFKNQKDLYQKALNKLIPLLEAPGVSEIYYATGNHDDVNILSKSINRGKIVRKNETFNIGTYSFYANHYYEETRPKVDYFLFGHSFEPRSRRSTEETVLNGLTAINIIDLSTGKVFNLTYPFGTNRCRKMELRRIGI